MNPRVVFRTHYQVDEPAYLRILLQVATSPVRTAYRENVAERVARAVRGLGKDFNLPAAEYVIDLGRGLGVLSDDHTWTPHGQLLGLLSSHPSGSWRDQLSLNDGEKLGYLRVFLQGDGAALIYLARHIDEAGAVPVRGEDWNELAQAMFVRIYEEYRDLTGTTAERVRLRTDLDRIRKGYSGKSGSHKLFVHLQTMYRIGLVERTGDGGRKYARCETQVDPAGVLLAALPSAYALERAVDESRLSDIAAATLGHVLRDDVVDLDTLWTDLAQLYREILTAGIALCPLATLIEATQIQGIIRRGVGLTYGAILEAIERTQRSHTREIRFHVDRRGRPAFLKLSEEWVDRYIGGVLDSTTTEH